MSLEDMGLVCGTIKDDAIIKVTPKVLRALHKLNIEYTPITRNKTNVKYIERNYKDEYGKFRMSKENKYTPSDNYGSACSPGSPGSGQSGGEY